MSSSATQKQPLITHDACQVGNVSVTVHVMVDSAFTSSVALGFETTATGLSTGFHGSLEEVREFARILDLHVKAGEQAIADRLGVDSYADIFGKVQTRSHYTDLAAQAEGGVA